MPGNVVVAAQSLRRELLGTQAASTSIPRRIGLQRQVALCELLDRVLNKGVVLVGEVTISVADIDLLYLGINLVISSVETLLSHAGGGEIL